MRNNKLSFKIKVLITILAIFIAFAFQDINPVFYMDWR
jgi:hypothetical protein